MAEETKSSTAVESKKDVELVKFVTEEGGVTANNPRGIPQAIFIENVEEFLGNNAIEAVLGAYQDLYGKYKYMEQSFEKSKSVYKGKVPDIENTLDIIKLLIAKKESGEGEVVTNYSLTDTVFGKAKVNTNVGKVCLWIGASTMVEYSYEEALELLTKQLAQTHEKIAELNTDLTILRENSITVEVNMARLFNHNVKLKKLTAASS